MKGKPACYENIDGTYIRVVVELSFTVGDGLTHRNTHEMILISSYYHAWIVTFTAFAATNVLEVTTASLSTATLIVSGEQGKYAFKSAINSPPDY